MDCSVCCERVTKRNTVTCHFCDFVTCKSCAKRFVLESINTLCMNCKKPWNREVITQNLGKTFVTKEYKQKRERDLFETEKALLPETQPFATAKKEIAELNKEIFQLQKRLKELKLKKILLQSGNTDENIFKERAAKLTIKCPVGECRGFVNSSNMICEVCDVKLCKDCREPLGKDDDGKGEPLEHTCDPNTLETVKLLKKDTKSCPKCSVGIHKIEGCDQMYCTQCHTAFSWRTGEIVIGERIHNPHYYEYLRKTGGMAPRELGDIPCGGIPTEWQMREFVNESEIMSMLRTLVHIERVEFRNYRTDRVQNNRDLRIKYLNNEISESNFKTTLQRREKDLEKKREILQVLNTCVVAGSDILRSLTNDKDVKKANDSLKTLREFTNESMTKVSKLYGCVVPVFRDIAPNLFVISGIKF
jgi:hypothetical protein